MLVPLISKDTTHSVEYRQSVDKRDEKRWVGQRVGVRLTFRMAESTEVR
jgi:hypothetical protein